MSQSGTPNFSDVLNVPVNAVERPPVYPFGTYVAFITKAPSERDFSGKDGRSWKAFEFPCRLVSAREDVDADLLATYTSKAGDLSKGRPVDVTLMGENTEEGKGQLRWNLRQFFVNKLGLEPEDKTLGQLAAEAIGKQLLVTLRWENYQDKNSGEQATAARVQSTAKL